MNRKRTHVLQEQTNLSTTPLQAFQSQPMMMYNLIDTSNTPSIQLASFPTPFRYVYGKQEEMRLRRLARYSASEQALAESFRHCESQQPLQEFHLEALQKATCILNTLAADARDAVDRLRVLLANRSAEPTLYKSMQRQRWMEEKRHVALDQLSKTLCTELARLSSSTNIGQTLTLESSNSKSNTNLVKFFEPSRCRTTIRSGPCRGISLPQDKQSDDSHIMELPRRHNENYIIPLVLKSPRQRRFFSFSCTQSPEDLSTSSSSVENITATASTISESSNLETIAEDNQTIPHIVSPNETDGTVLIWRDVPRSKEEILRELEVPMPDYVMDLLADFESNSRPGPITLPPRLEFNTSLPTTPRKPIPKSPSRSRLNNIFSGIPETFTSRLTNTNESSDAAKASRVRLGLGVVEEPSQPIAMTFPSGSQALGTEKMIVRIRRRISTLGRT